MKTIHTILQTVLLSAFYSVLILCEKPELTIFPNVSTVRAPTHVPFYLHCMITDGRADDTVQMTWKDPKGRTLPEGLNFRYGMDVRRQSSRSLKLLFMMPVVAHSGEYACTAIYPDVNERDETATSVYPRTIVASISVEFYVRPKITKFENTTVAENQRAVLACTATGATAPNVTIRRENGQIFKENEDNRTRVEHTTFFTETKVTLTIELAARADDGLYYCYAETNELNTTKAAHLDVQFAPRVNATLAKQVMARSENSTNLTCIAEANPEAVIQWKFEHEEIHPEDEHYVIHHVHRGNRVISNVTVKRNVTNESRLHGIFGTYTCTAVNTLGENSIYISLEEEKANVPGEISQVIIDRVTPTNLTFRIFGPFSDGGMPVTAFVVNYSSPESHNLTIEWPKGTDYILRNLTPGANYTFRLAAKNVIGLGPWKRMHYVMPRGNDTENPTLITKNVNITDYPDRFEIKWKVPDSNGQTKRYFVVTYFNDGRVMVQHSKRGNSSSLVTRATRQVKHDDFTLHFDSTEDDGGSSANN